MKRNPSRFASLLGAAAFAVVWTATGTARAGDGLTIPVLIGSVTCALAEPDETHSVLSFLREYESTLASGRVERIVSLYSGFDSARRPELESYFRDVIRDLLVRLDEIRIEVDGNRAEVRFDREDSFVDRASGEHVKKRVDLTRHLVRNGAGWRIMLDGEAVPEPEVLPVGDI